MVNEKHKARPMGQPLNIGHDVADPNGFVTNSRGVFICLQCRKKTYT